MLWLKAFIHVRFVLAVVVSSLVNLMLTKAVCSDKLFKVRLLNLYMVFISVLGQFNEAIILTNQAL